MGALPEVSDRAAVRYDYFPTTWQAVLWRCWGAVPVEKLSEALGADEATLRAEANRLGLDGNLEADPAWLERGYLTLIRETWHLLSFEQITVLLGVTDETLAFLLKEDDFLWHKMGQIKPRLDAPRYAPLTDGERVRTDAFRRAVRMETPYPDPTKDNAFEFVRGFMREVTDAERAAARESVRPSDGLRTVYSYFALYGDPLLNPALDPFPEALLMEYAKMGVKGVWLQGILYQLVEFPFAPEMSAGCETRRKNLAALVERAARYGIRVYLYLNEPRAMNAAFFEKYPELRGRREGDFWAMCTSTEPVKAYLEDAMVRLFSGVKGLGGFFTITMSENLTNCHSRFGDGVSCPRCEKRAPEEVVAEVNNLLARGAKRADPNAVAVAWNWAWGEDWCDKVAPLLTEGEIVQCTSEERLPTRIAGIDGYVVDYTMSLCGPGPKAKRVWASARAAGRECCAKVQFNNTWEMSACPYLPVMDKVAGHVNNLKAVGVKHLQLSWTLGGYPSPNLKLAGYLMDGRGDVESFLREEMGEELGDIANRAQKKLSEAFGEFPFHIGVLYVAPQNYAPMSPFFLEKTGWQATMIGFPYDDLDSWRAIYPRDAFLAQWEKLCALWREGARSMDAARGRSDAFDDMARMADAALCHFESTLHHVRFVMARDDGDRAEMARVVREERETVLRALALRREDSRVGYEASNHYYYTTRDLVEKLINLRWIEERLAKM